jgi:tripeptidyl-peptidase-1
LHFRPDFPSSSPYVVSVGATTFPDEKQAVTGNEVGVGFSSGGFSNHFPMPSYQQGAVAKFLDQTPVPPALFNRSGRGFPDVSAVGVKYQIVVNGKVGSAGGTSASTPAFAGVLSLLNSARLAKGQRTLGWANPLLYQHTSEMEMAMVHSRPRPRSTLFYDVTQGNNKHGSCCGFNATAGWDPMTGLGTPNYHALLDALTLTPTSLDTLS